MCTLYTGQQLEEEREEVKKGHIGRAEKGKTKGLYIRTTWPLRSTTGRSCWSNFKRWVSPFVFLAMNFEQSCYKTSVTMVFCWCCITTYTLVSYRSPVLSACFRGNPPSWRLRRVSPPCSQFIRFLRQAFAKFQTYATYAENLILFIIMRIYETKKQFLYFEFINMTFLMFFFCCFK